MALAFLPGKKAMLLFLENMILLTVGALLFALGAECVAARGGFLVGDIYGLGILVWSTTGTLTPPIWFLIFNVPLFILAWVHVGRVFFFYSLYGMLITTVFSMVLQFEVEINNQLYSAVASGLICGAGIGIMLRSLGSGSGLDVVGMILNRRWGVGLGQTHLYFNGFLFLGCLVFINTDTVIVSIIQVYLSSFAMEKVMSMFSQRKLIFIMSDHSKEIAKRITRRLGIGATFLDGRGAYSGENRDVIMTVANNLQLKRLEQTVFSTDKNALFIVENSFAVRGHRDFVINNSALVPDFFKAENDEDPKKLDKLREQAELAVMRRRKAGKRVVRKADSPNAQGEDDRMFRDQQ
jgi:Uncharacterized conserved protein